MISPASEQQRESYRERLYLHYVATHFGTDAAEVHSRVESAVHYFRRLLKYIPKDKSAEILDLGCGCGSLLYWLKDAGYTSLEGIDRSPEQVAAAHSLGLTLVKAGDILDHVARREPESSDVVIAFDVIEHLEKEEAFELADGVFRVLRPGGLFILHLPNGEGLFSGCVAFNDLTHELILTSGSLGQLLRCVGFSDVSTYEDTPIVHGPISAARYVIWMVIKSILRLVYAAQTGNIGRELILSQNFLAIARKP